ncbi:MAG: ribose-phosphate pyrophosphokinase [Candidatus Levybacteria bacterium]|nr:ribose-phosphate pyrophosphokinase [Candidatus Levybacteria bacterium]
MASNNGYILLTGRANPKLAKDIAKILKKELLEPITIFSDGEIRVRIARNLRRRHVFIIQPTCPPCVNDYIMELILMIDAVKRASASEIIAVIPYFGYSRQDRKEMPRVPISASAIASMIEHTGANRIVTVDIHAEQEEGFIRSPWDNLYASYSLLPVIKSRNLKNLVVASPDKGGVVRATGYAKLLDAEGIAIVYKQRDINVNDKSESQIIIGDVVGKDVLLVDDLISTGGTIINAGDYIKERGARSVRAAVTHQLFTGSAFESVTNSAIEEFIITDTVAVRNEVVKHKKITVVSVAPLLAQAISRIESGESISKDLIL